MSIQDLMAAAAKAQAAKTAAAAAASGAAASASATGAAAAAGGAGEGETQTTQAAAAGAGAAGDGKGKEGAGAGSDAGAGGEGAAAVAAAAAATPDLTALVEKVTSVSIANAKLEAEVTALTLNCAAMVTVVSDSLDRMSIALGGGKIDVAKMSVDALVAQHASTAATFAAKFPVGGVAAVNVDTEKDQETQAATERARFEHSQRVAAAAGSFAAKK